MQKIAFHLNSLQQGGAERVVSNLANRFAKEGYEVVIATEWYGTDEFALDQKVRRVHVGLTKEDENRSRISKMLRRIWYLRRFMKKEKPDVVVAFDPGRIVPCAGGRNRDGYPGRDFRAYRSGGTL